MAVRIAYFVNEYPKVSHSFIRREIHALERKGLEVERIALRGWDEELVDEQDWEERRRTRYVLQEGALPLLGALLRTLLTSPVSFFRALALALRMGWHSERPVPYHVAYLAEACRMLPWLDSFGASHLHAHFATNSAEVAMLVRELGGPSYSFTVHGTEFFDKPAYVGMAEKVRRAAFVVATSSYGRGQIFRWTDYASWPKVRVVQCGLEPDFYDVPPVTPPAAPRFVCVGRLSGEKGQRLLVEAVHRLREKGVAVELVLAGDGDDRAELEKLIARRGLSDRVRITGWISSDRVREEIVAARALVLPSFAEGLPVVIMEAMALRRPVVATHVAGIPELVRPGENGWLVPAGAVDELAAALEDCVATPALRLEAMGRAGRSLALERHSVDTEAKKLVELFQTVAS